MPVTAIPNYIIPASMAILPRDAGNLNLSTSAINASGDRYGWVFQAPKSGTLHSFEHNISVVSNNPDNGLRLSFQDVSLSTGNPDGAQDQFFDQTGTISTGWNVPGGPITNDGTGGGVKRTVVHGDYLSCVVDFTNFVAGDSVTGVVGANCGVTVVNNSYICDGNSGAYAKVSSSFPIFALKYDDGTYAKIPGLVLPIVSITNQAFNNTSTPDERGLRFQVEFDCKISGFWMQISANQPADAVLYDNASSVLATVVIDPEVRQGVSAITKSWFYFSSAISLTANTTYRLVLKPTTVNSVTLQQFNATSNAILEATDGGIEWYLTSRTDAGAWTDTTTSQPFIGIILSELDVSSGGGGGAFTFVG
jgi:hypothetical protein